MGCVGWAKLVKIDTRFQYKPGEGNLVTGTFQHEVGDAVDLYVEGQDEPIGVTETHPFWSVDRQDFVPVGELVEGERLLLFNGETKRVAQKLPRPGPECVYNLEILGEHVYLVTLDGIYVHNQNCAISNRSINGRTTPRQSEQDSVYDLQIIFGKENVDAQVSYLGGKAGLYGKGCVRPDAVVKTKSGVLAVEVKNYDLVNNFSHLKSVVKRQFAKRANELPTSHKQFLVIDARGQTLTKDIFKKIIDFDSELKNMFKGDYFGFHIIM